MDRRVGKVKWFSSARNSGVLASIGGTSLRFTSAAGTRAAAGFTAGQVVTYEVGENGAISPFANEVRAESVAGRARLPRRTGGRRADDRVE